MFDASPNEIPLLSLQAIDKRFAMVYALKEVSLDIMPGETMALVGENGAGKSTLMKILTGVYTKDKGDIFLNGLKINITNPLAARKNGIGQIYQQAELVPELTAAENMLLGEPDFGRRGIINWNDIYAKTDAIFKKYNMPIDSRSIIKDISVANRQMVAIAKILQWKPKIIIFDEPTAVLSDKEVVLLFDLINQLKKEKITIIYISHRLEEIFNIADRISVMRDGALVTVLKNKDLTKESLIIHMLGRKVDALFPPKKNYKTNEVLLEAKNITTNKVANISFKLYRGEILGLAGLVGSGRTELARALYGLDKIKSGEIYIKQKKATVNGPKDMVKKGLFLAPEDRRREGLVLVRSIRDNIILANLSEVSKFGWCLKSIENKIINDLKKSLNIKAKNVDTLAGQLSGGNQQKVVIAKAFMSKPDILIFDEPTQGIDVGAKSEIYSLLTRLQEQGKAILFISSEIEELQGVCSRMLIMRNGRLAGEIASEDETEIQNTEKILNLMYRS